MDTAPDRKRTQEFARKLFGFYTGGMLTLLVQVGHQVGLFDAAAKGPGTSAEIAGRAGLDERYVREWLAAMATAGVVEYDAASRRFTLPPEHATCLTGTSSRNLAAGSQTLPMLAKRLSGVIESFRRGGGVPYSDFSPDFTEAQDASWRLLYDGLLVKGFLPAVKGLPESLRGGIRVADLGCGTGHAVNLMAREYPASDFVGYDFGEDAIERARAEARAMGVGNALVRPRHLVRRHPRSARSGGRAQARRRRLGARRRLPHDGAAGLEQPRGQHRQPVHALHLRDERDALHDGLAGCGRRGPRHGVG